MIPLVSTRIATRFGPENSVVAVISNGLRSNSAVKVLTLRSCGTSPCESRMPTGIMRFVQGDSCAHNEHARRKMSVTPAQARTIEESYRTVSRLSGGQLLKLPHYPQNPGQRALTACFQQIRLGGIIP